MVYSYEEFLEDLSMGREVHFIYRDEEYYIGCGTGKFMFWKSYDTSGEIIGKDMEDLLRKVKLDGKLIKEIWNLIEIDTIF
jgi:tricorn protease-like protein